MASILLFILCLIAPSLLEANPPAAEDIKEINIITAEWQRYTDKDGTGYYFDVLREVYEPLGFRLNPKYIPVIRGVSLLQSGKFDIILGITHGLLEADRYSNQPIEIDQLCIAIPTRLNESWKGIESLKKLRSASIPGIFSTRGFNVGKEHIQVKTSESMIKMLLAGRIDAAIDFEITLKSELKKFPTENKFIIKKSNFMESFYFAFSPSNKGTTLKEIFNQEMIKLRQSGKLREIMIRNLGDDSRYPKD